MKLPKQRLCPFLSFTGNAEEAMRFYVKILPDAEIETLVLFEKDEPNGDMGKVLNGVISFAGSKIMFLDMQKSYPAPAFSWATSFFINCVCESEFDKIFVALSEGGTVMMGPEPIMQIRKCAWVTDKFGVTWQLVFE